MLGPVTPSARPGRPAKRRSSVPPHKCPAQPAGESTSGTTRRTTLPSTARPHSAKPRADKSTSADHAANHAPLHGSPALGTNTLNMRVSTLSSEDTSNITPHWGPQSSRTTQWVRLLDKIFPISSPRTQPLCDTRCGATGHVGPVKPLCHTLGTSLCIYKSFIAGRNTRFQPVVARAPLLATLSSWPAFLQGSTFWLI